MSSVKHYQEEISQLKPSCFALLLDQSGSMAAAFGGNLEGATNPTKAHGAADAINRCLREIAIRCTKEEGIRDYFDIGIWGYGGSLKLVLGRASSGTSLLPVSEVWAKRRIEDRMRDVSDGVGGLVAQAVKVEVWVDPVADSGTPMCGALGQAKEEVERWVSEHPESYAPTVINITDGEATDGDPRGVAAEIRGIRNAHGSNVLLFNIHISDKNLPPVLYPATASGLSADYAEMLFEMSSELPEKLMQEGAAGGLPVTRGSRGFVFNGNLVDLIKFLDIGTRPMVDAAR